MYMLHPLLIVVSLLFLPLSVGHAQEAAAKAPVHIRAVFHDPIRPVADLYYPDSAGTLQRLEFRPQDLTRSLLVQPVDGSLVLYDKAVIDPEKPGDGVAAMARLDPNIRRAMVVVLPAQTSSKTPYRMLVIDDSEKAFPFGESLAISLVGTEIGIQAGEQKVLVQPGQSSRIPFVRKVNDFNMAQTNFHYQQNDSTWVAFTERQLQFVDVCRRLFIIHTTPGALQPRVTTIVDTKIDRAEPAGD